MVKHLLLLTLVPFIAPIPAPAQFSQPPSLGINLKQLAIAQPQSVRAGPQISISHSPIQQKWTA